MLRLILVLLFLILFFVLTIPWVLVLIIIGLFNKELKDTLSFYTVKYGFKIVLFISGTKVAVNGLENIPDRASLFIGNHLSFFDIVTAYSVLPKPTGFISKKEVARVPGLNWWMLLMKCLFLDRKDARKGLETIKKASEYITDGISIFIFPEGTRSRTGETAEFKEGSFKVATKAGCPVVPVALTNTRDILENHCPIIKKASVSISFGTPIETENLSRTEKKQLGETTRQTIIRMLGSQN